MVPRQPRLGRSAGRHGAVLGDAFSDLQVRNKPVYGSAVRIRPCRGPKGTYGLVTVDACGSCVIGMAAVIDWCELRTLCQLEPIRGSSPVLGTRVALDVNDVGRVALGGSMGPEIDRVEGRLIERDNGEYLLGVTSVSLLRRRRAGVEGRAGRREAGVRVAPSTSGVLDKARTGSVRGGCRRKRGGDRVAEPSRTE